MSEQKGGIGAQIAGNIASVGLQGIINRRAERRQWNRNVSMWKMQNEYNSPINQMKRLKEAGLNPNLMYGKGTVGNSQTLPQYNALPPQGMGEVFGKSIAGLQGLAQTDKLKTEIQANDIANDFNRINNIETLKQNKEQTKAIAAGILLTKAQTALEGDKQRTERKRTKLVEQEAKNAGLTGEQLREAVKQATILTNRYEFGIESAGAGIKATFETMKAQGFNDDQIRLAIAGLQITDKMITIMIQALGLTAVTRILGGKRMTDYQAPGQIYNTTSSGDF
jgi:hypothetical protein